MAFTDEDLKDLKEVLRGTVIGTDYKINDLLARLEAAEAVISEYVYDEAIKDDDLIKAWRKSKGVTE